MMGAKDEVSTTVHQQHLASRSAPRVVFITADEGLAEELREMFAHWRTVESLVLDVRGHVHDPDNWVSAALELFRAYESTVDQNNTNVSESNGQ